ncbi:hypothetical protein BN946_scf184977.g139 [Trametes cinnabarina]|uniref:Nucleolar 27S pre-rRNA processing Urb2/Npa2 C-terminal domain-containing protein n=1 Tax=Pycnoporus cinnabarinus TaxID=5643 RepID=A0A060SJ30_PYCCI|nr:hypothetical protein BN946_scf184977.g139 [Trametes cinnabarina]
MHVLTEFISATNPVCDTRYWNLLHDILVSSGGEKYGDHSRALRAWLVPLLNRVPIAPTILSYFNFASADGSFDIAQYTLFSRCVVILWPLAVPKFSPETLLECFGGVVQLLVARAAPGILDGQLSSQDGSRSKRKQLYTMFLHKYIQSWLQAATRSCEGEGARLQLALDIYDAGIDTLFGLDLLKPAADQKHDSALADALERILQVSSEIVLRPLPRVFASYVQTVKRHKGALFGQGSNHASGQVADQVPPSATAALQYLDLLLDYDSKTRKLPSTIMHISEAFSVQHLQRIPSGPRLAYEVASAGPLTSLPFLDRLARAVHNFLTPSQVLETVKDVSQGLNAAYERFMEREAKISAHRGEAPRKKRRKEGSTVEDRTEPEYHAVSFCLLSQTMVVVLRSLPLHIVTDDVRMDAVQAVREVHTMVASRALREGLLQSNRKDAWHWQMIISGALHLHYGLTSWTGKAHVLNSEAEAALAALHILTDRWLPHFDAWASPEQHRRFVRILTAAKLDSPALKGRSDLTVSAVISRMLHDAQFWELLNIRDAFLTQLQGETASLDEQDLNKLLSGLASDNLRRVPNDVLHCISAYEILLLTPPEYLPRALHVEFLKRGFVADVLLFAALRSGKEPAVLPRHFLTIREYLRRTIAYLGSIENMVTKEFLDYLIGYAAAGSLSPLDSAHEVSSVTMDLVDMYQSAIVRAAKRGNPSILTDLIHRYVELYATDDHSIGRRASMLLIDSLVQEGPAADFPQDVLSSLSEGLPEPPPPLDVDVLDIWSHMQVLGRWSKREGNQLPSLGKPLARRLLKWTDEKQDVAHAAPAVLAILLGEVEAAAAAQRKEQIEYVVVAYLALARMCDRQETKRLETRLSGAFRTLSTDNFSIVLEMISDGLPLSRGLSLQDVTHLVRFAIIALQHAPEGTSRVCQSFATRCLKLFADDERFITEQESRGEVVEFVVRQCSDRPASLRVADLPSLWSFIRSVLAGSSTHEHSTDTAVFHGVVNILSALVRLRRDLVLNTLPHLGFVLRQLVSCLRSLRPQLGGKQSRMVMDTLPRWISSSQPLGAQESKALARLLTTLTTKTMIRVHGAGAESQKPESLMRPFSKHAAYVLTAYVEAVNDPLCFVSSGIRRELQPGLFALCDMLGEHNRDAMMVSALDTGGKAVMKALWKEYEKQRYVGKG